MMKEENHIFQGLRRDNHQIKQDSKFLWNAHNIRLTNRDDNTLLSITNERGTLDTGVSLNGHYVGHCTVGRFLVVFTDEGDDGNCYIYRIEKDGNKFKTIILFEQSGWEGRWKEDHPIQTIGLYETELIQKVYWIDDIHQPRVINVAKPELKIPDKMHSALLVDGVNLAHPSKNEDNIIKTTLSAMFPTGLYSKDSFDFIRKLNLTEIVNVEKSYAYGEFPPGVIQYALSYYDKYGQESNIFYTTPLYYISHKDRAGNGEDKCANNFKITVTNPDNFDYIRVYSIHRTSIDAVPTIKIVGDISVVDAEKTNNGKIASIVDTGTEGITIDNYQLLYIGGKGIIAKTFVKKDNTIFFGNISYINNVSKKIENLLKNKIQREDILLYGYNNGESTRNSYYEYKPSLDKYNAKFKVGETYRCGVQAQLDDGTWTDPIYYDDCILSSDYTELFEGNYKASALSINVDTNTLDTLRNFGVKKFRSCVVFPKTGERDIICQGILNPTIYSTKDRENLGLFNISSWFFRPINIGLAPSLNVRKGSNIVFEHKSELPSPDQSDEFGAEIQGYKPKDTTTDDDKTLEYIKVDENTVTFHSPDVEFDTTVQNTPLNNTYLRIIGCANLRAVAGKININIKSAQFGSDTSSAGVNEFDVGFTYGEEPYGSGLVTGLFYKDELVNKEFDITKNNSYALFPIYPWHRSGSLNNDSKRPDGKGERTAVLDKKVISNLKFFGKNIPISYPKDYSIITPQLFDSNELSILKFKPPYIQKDVRYMGNIDRVYISGTYPLYIGEDVNSFHYTKIDDSDEAKLIYESKDPVRIKYKSTPHLLMSLVDSNTSNIPLLPRITAQEEERIETEDIPDGISTGSNDNLYNPNDVYEKPLGCVTRREDRLEQYIDDINLTSSIHSYDNILCDGTKNSNGLLLTPHSFPGKTVILKVPASKNHFSPTMIPPSIYFPNNYPVLKALDRSEFGDVSSIGWCMYKGGTTKYLKFHLEDDGKLKNCKVVKVEDVTALIDTTPSSGSSIKYNLIRDKLKLPENIIDTDQIPTHYLFLADLCRINVVNKFGGNTDEALQANQWFPASDPVDLSANMTLPLEYGDTWYARYDCLKTYPFTEEDENQIVEIGSFMCETRYNIDGRYDRNRGQYDNTSMRPTNFNHMNEVYSQKNNYFNYRIFNEDYYKQDTFVNQVIYSLGKNAGEEVDTWAKITSATPIDMDGENGEITSLNTWGENLLCFQEKALSQIMFNSRVQVQTSDGVPIEIANSNKVDGVRLLSDHVGCKDKWSILSATSGLYFVDHSTDSLYAFNGQLVNIGESNGMDWWPRDVHTENTWKPSSYSSLSSILHPYDNANGIRLFYDDIYGDIYFTPGPSTDQKDALCYSEQLGHFTSLMSYGGTQAMFNFADNFCSLKNEGNKTNLFLNNKGDYNNFFGKIKGWDFSFISNDNPTYTKIFDTIELRADHYNKAELLNSCPINFMRISNEYQDSDGVYLDSKNMRKKFRVWRGLLPRNKNTRQRIRNPWSMITLGWVPITPIGGSRTAKAVIHDVSVKYTV